MFWSTVGHARRQTARAMGPSTIERSNVDDLVDGGWIRRFYRVPPTLTEHVLDRRSGDQENYFFREFLLNS
jgi:hypothetical protein